MSIDNKVAIFLKQYYSVNGLIDRLTLVHDFIDAEFEKDNVETFNILRKLLIHFNDDNKHPSE